MFRICGPISWESKHWLHTSCYATTSDLTGASSTEPPVFIRNAESLCSQVYSKSHGTANVDLSARSNSKLSCNPI